MQQQKKSTRKSGERTDKMDKMMENKVQIEKKWKKMEEEGKLHSENGTMTFTSTPSKEEQCTVDIDENIKGIE